MVVFLKLAVTFEQCSFGGGNLLQNVNILNGYMNDYCQYNSIN